MGPKKEGVREHRKPARETGGSQGFKPPRSLRHLMKLHLQNTAHEGFWLQIEWEGKSIVQHTVVPLNTQFHFPRF